MKALFLFLLTLTFTAEARIAPPFSTQLMSGKKLSLQESLKPGRVTLVSFWATWCAPCIEELKNVSAKLKADSSLPLDVITINVDTSETTSDVKPTIKLNQFSFPVALDPEHQIFGKYSEAKTLPYSVLVDEKGQIIAQFNGYNEAMFDEIKQAVKK